MLSLTTFTASSLPSRVLKILYQQRKQILGIKKSLLKTNKIIIPLKNTINFTTKTKQELSNLQTLIFHAHIYSVKHIFYKKYAVKFELNKNENKILNVWLMV